MSPKQIVARTVPKTHYRDYLEKAKQFYGTMMTCLQDREWDAILLLGVHAAISVTDALIVFHSEKRSTSKSHQDAVTLLIQTLPSDPDVKQNATRLSQIINEKHKVEYEPKRFSEKEALEFVKKVERYLQWAQTKLPVAQEEDKIGDFGIER